MQSLVTFIDKQKDHSFIGEHQDEILDMMEKIYQYIRKDEKIHKQSEKIYQKCESYVRQIHRQIQSFLPDEVHRHDLILQRCKTQNHAIEQYERKEKLEEKLVESAMIIVRDKKSSEYKKAFEVVGQIANFYRKLYPLLAAFNKSIGLLLHIDFLLKEKTGVLSDKGFYFEVDKLYSADQGIRLSGNGLSRFFGSFYYNTLKGGSIGVFKGMDPLSIDKYCEDRLQSLLRFKKFEAIKDVSVLLKIFFIVQHSDNNIAFMKEMFEQFKRHPMIHHPKLKRKLAFLTDRVGLKSGEQVFGTQRYNTNTIMALFPIKGAEIAEVRKSEEGLKYAVLTGQTIHYIDSKRAEYGLIPLEKYFRDSMKELVPQAYKAIQKEKGVVYMWVESYTKLRGQS